MSAKVQNRSTAGLREALEQIEGVERAVVEEGDTPVVYLICPRSETPPPEVMARAILLKHGYASHQVELHVCHFPTAQPRRRVRFVAADLARPRVGRSIATVTLEWEGREVQEETEGESGTPTELRLAALATIRALDRVMDGVVTFHLLGIKTVRAFDTDLVVVLLRADDDGTGPFLGSAIVGESATRAATVAVLNATNRVLGNYLNTDN